MEDIKKQINKVDELPFWKTRLESAARRGLIHTSVYETSKPDWDSIEKAHFQILHEKIKPEEKVLDVGCGYGRLAPEFDNYVGFDFSPDFIEAAQNRYPKKDFRLLNAIKLPFKDQEFDWAVGISFRHMIIYYLGVDKWLELEKELKRVAKKIILLEYTDLKHATIL